MNPYQRGGKTYDLRAPDVAERAGRGLRWVYVHAGELLGGVKSNWGIGKRETLRFCSEEVDEVLKRKRLA